MNEPMARALQALLLEKGYRIRVDGDWGEESQRAALDAISQSPKVAERVNPAVAPREFGGRPLSWGKKVSSVFRDRVFWMSDALLMPKANGADMLMSCMAFESGETFSPSVKNAAGSGATGLIQFMPATARGMGTTVEALAALTAEDQLKWVYRYFEPYKGRLQTLPDVYMAILLPSMVGKPDSAILFSGGVSYRQNSGLDANKDGKVTKAEAAAKVQAKFIKGMTAALRWPG